MIDLLNYISSSPLQAIMVILLFVAASKGVYESVGWVRKQFENWYNIKKKSDDEKEIVDNRIATLEKNDNKQFEMIEDIQKTINEIGNKFDDVINDRKEEVISMTRAELNSIYPIIKDQGYLTKNQYETWLSLSQIYLSRGGNHIFAEKIIPEINNLPIKDL